MTEQERIESIKKNGGRHLQNFKGDNVTYDMCLAAVQSTGHAICFVPDKFLTEEIYQEACKHGGTVLRIVPAKYVKKEICEWAVENEGLALEFVPDKFKTEKVCLKAVIKEQQAYKFVPETLITPKFVVEVAQRSKYDSVSSIPKPFKKNPFYLELVKIDPEFIWYLPKTAFTASISKAVINSMGCKTTADAIKKRPDLLARIHVSLYDHDACLSLVQSDYFLTSDGKSRWGPSLHGFNAESDEEKGRLYLQGKFEDSFTLPDMMKWSDVILPIVKLNGYYIKFAKEDAITEEICFAAIESNPHSIEYIPNEFKTKELYLKAYEIEPFIIKEIPEEYIDYELALQGIKHSGFLLEYIPTKFRTKELCLIAVSDEGAGKLEWVPKEVIDKEIIIAYLSNNRWAVNQLADIPTQFIDYDVCLAAVKKDGGSLKSVPEEYKTYELCLAAIKRSPYELQYVPKEHFTEELCMASVTKGRVDFKYIPKECLTEKICLEVVKHGERYSGTSLEEIPDELKTQEMCNIAMEVSVWSLKAVPEKFVTEEMLIDVAHRAPGRLCDNFPERFRSGDALQRILDAAPSAKGYIDRIINKED